MLLTDDDSMTNHSNTHWYNDHKNYNITWIFHRYTVLMISKNAMMSRDVDPRLLLNISNQKFLKEVRIINPPSQKEILKLRFFLLWYLTCWITQFEMFWHAAYTGAVGALSNTTAVIILFHLPVNVSIGIQGRKHVQIQQRRFAGSAHEYISTRAGQVQAEEHGTEPLFENHFNSNIYSVYTIIQSPGKCIDCRVQPQRDYCTEVL